MSRYSGKCSLGRGAGGWRGSSGGTEEPGEGGGPSSAYSCCCDKHVGGKESSPCYICPTLGLLTRGDKALTKGLSRSGRGVGLSLPLRGSAQIPTLPHSSGHLQYKLANVPSTHPAVMCLPHKS